jgi:UDP-glucose 4-epimerase
VEVASLIEQAAKRTVERSRATPRSGDIKDSVADIGRARVELGYSPGVDVDEGLRRLVESLAESR